MTDTDRDKWDAIHRARREVVGEPAAFLTSAAETLPRVGAALDMAGGRGRHALWLAGRGLDVTLADVSPVALEAARHAASGLDLKLTTRLWDADNGWLPGPWHLIVVFHFLDRSLLATVADVLAPGAMFLFCQPTERNLERHPKPSRRFTLAEGELREVIDPRLTVVSLVEDWSSEGRHEARLVATVRP